MCAIFGLDRLVCALTVLCVLEIGTGLLNALLLSLGPADSVAIVRPPLLFNAHRFYIVYRQSPLAAVDPAFRALSERIKFTVLRHKFNKDSLASERRGNNVKRFKAMYLQAKAIIWL